MKNIYLIMLSLLAMCLSFTACSDEDPFSTITPDDEPHILNPIFPDRKDGKLVVFSNINRDANLVVSLTVTPSEYTQVMWFIDGEEVATGTDLDINLKAGTYTLKVIAGTSIGKSTYREALVQVNPLPDDPWSTESGFERIVTPGAEAVLYGDNLDKVKSIIIAGKTITDVVYNDEYLAYTLPSDISEGNHRVILVDSDGNEYGANTVNITKSALVISGAGRASANSEWNMSGINLNDIASLTIGGQPVTEFTKQSSTEIAFICPSLADGEYKLYGRTKGGNPVQFYDANEVVAEVTVTISSETTIWEGHHYVSWDLPDDNPNKKFDLIGKDVFAKIKAGATLSIHYSIAPEAEYHQLRTTTAWWSDLPGTSAIEFSENGTVKVLLTQDMLDAISAEDGFLCIGHGYYVDLVTVK